MGLVSGAEYSTAALLILAVGALAFLIALATHLLGPGRSGDTKMSTYESGMVPVGDARKRFNVRFYLVAVLFIVFDVELIFLYPWAMVFPAMKQAAANGEPWAGAMIETGHNETFVMASILIFFALLLVGFIYEWKKGIFKWD
jgi:NADH-quinone oxidoreductase subunit A